MAAPDMELKAAFAELQAKMIESKQKIKIHDIQIDRPVVIAGQGRTGTTHLHNLMSADTSFRTMPYWESVEPVPPRVQEAFEPHDDEQRVGRHHDKVRHAEEHDHAFREEAAARARGVREYGK